MLHKELEIKFCKQLRHFTDRIYHQNGKLWKKIQYVNGKKHGVEIKYDNDGQLISAALYENDHKLL